MFILIEFMKLKDVITHYDGFSLIVACHMNANSVAFKTFITTWYEPKDVVFTQHHIPSLLLSLTLITFGIFIKYFNNQFVLWYDE